MQVVLPAGLQSPAVGLFHQSLEPVDVPAGLQEVNLSLPAYREYWKDALHDPARASGSGGFVGLAAEVASSLLRPPRPRRRLLRPLQSPSVGLFHQSWKSCCCERRGEEQRGSLLLRRARAAKSLLPRHR